MQVLLSTGDFIMESWRGLGRDFKDHPVMMDSAFGRVNKNKDPLGEKKPTPWSHLYLLNVEASAENKARPWREPDLCAVIP